MPVTVGPLEAATPAVPSISSVSISPAAGSVGDTFTASVSVSGSPTPTLTYQWNLDGVAISGATSSTYDAEAEGALTVSATATNSEGSDSATSAGVTVAAALAPPALPASLAALTVTAGTGGTYDASTENSGGDADQWYLWDASDAVFDGATFEDGILDDGLPDGISINASTGVITVTSGAAAQGAETYTVAAVNAAGSDTGTISVTVQAAVSNLVTNGTFDTDLSNWSNSDTGSATWASGRLRLERTSTGSSGGVDLQRQTISGFVIGETYLISATCNIKNVGSAAVYPSFGIDQVGKTPAPWVGKRAQDVGFDVDFSASQSFVASATTHILNLGVRGQSSGVIEFDDVSVVRTS